MKKKLNNSQKVIYWLAWAAICSLFAFAIVASINGIIKILN